MNNKLYLKLICVIAVIIASVFSVKNTNQAISAKVIKLNKGETYQLKIRKGSKVTVNKKKILKITKKGKIKALKTGTCIVKIKTGKKKLRVKVIIKKDNVSVVTPNPEATSLPVQTVAPGGYDTLLRGKIVSLEMLSDSNCKYIIEIDNVGTFLTKKDTSKISGVSMFECIAPENNNANLGDSVLLFIPLNFDMSSCNVKDDTAELGNIYGVSVI